MSIQWRSSPVRMWIEGLWQSWWMNEGKSGEYDDGNILLTKGNFKLGSYAVVGDGSEREDTLGECCTEVEHFVDFKMHESYDNAEALCKEFVSDLFNQLQFFSSWVYLLTKMRPKGIKDEYLLALREALVSSSEYGRLTCGNPFVLWSAKVMTKIELVGMMYVMSYGMFYTASKVSAVCEQFSLKDIDGSAVVLEDLNSKYRAFFNDVYSKMPQRYMRGWVGTNNIYHRLCTSILDRYCRIRV